MAAHSSILAWEIHGQKEPGGLQSKRLPRVRHDLVNNNNSSGEAHILEGEDCIYSQATDVASARSRAVVALGGQRRMCRDRGMHGTFMCVWFPSPGSLGRVIFFFMILFS